MGRVLRTALIGVIMVSTLMSAGYALAATYNGWMTGYAFGNLYGASGAPIVQTDFANHSPTYCSGDPAASWAWGTYIHTVSPNPIYLSNAKGQYWPVSDLDLWDNGDPYCTQGNYWVDIYFGRYTWTPGNCNCSGSPSGTCIYGTTDNCQDATNFGQHWSTYTSP